MKGGQFIIVFLFIVGVGVHDAHSQRKALETYVKTKRYFKRLIWNRPKNRYEFKSPIKKSQLKRYYSYFEVYLGSKKRYLLSKRYVDRKLHATFFFNSHHQITHWYYYVDTVKRKAYFYRKPFVIERIYTYEPLRGRIQHRIFYRKDGITPIKEEFFEHLYLRKIIIYYSNGLKKSETEYFEGKKYFYDKKGRITKVKRFNPQRVK